MSCETCVYSRATVREKEDVLLCGWDAPISLLEVLHLRQLDEVRTHKNWTCSQYQEVKQ
jgi:hypothetical protein